MSTLNDWGNEHLLSVARRAQSINKYELEKASDIQESMEMALFRMKMAREKHLPYGEETIARLSKTPQYAILWGVGPGIMPKIRFIKH